MFRGESCKYYKIIFFAFATILLCFSCYLFFRQFSTGVHSHFSWKCWLIGIVFLLTTFSPLLSLKVDSIGRKLYETAKKSFCFHFINLRFFVSFLLIIAAGIFFRLYRLDYYPWGLEGLLAHSAWMGEYAFRILDGEPYTPLGQSFFPGGPKDTLPFYWLAMFFIIFEPSLIALRYAMVFIGFVNAVLVFFTIKTILRNGASEYDSNIVLIALSGMGVYLFSSVDTVLNYSAFEGTVTTPIMLAGFLSLNWAFGNKSYFAFCLSGLLFGLLLSSSIYFIPAAPAFIIVISYYAVYNYFGRVKSVPSARVFDSEGERWRASIGIFFIGALFVVLPKILCMLLHYKGYTSFIFFAAEKVSNEQNFIAVLNSFASKISSVFTLMFFDSYFGKLLIGDNTIVDKFVAPIFLLGIICSLVRIKSKRYLFLVCYLCFTIVECIMAHIFDYRFIPFMPFIYIFFSVGIYLIYNLLKYRKTFYILAGIYLIVIVSFNAKRYYTGMGISPLVSSYSVKDTLIGRYLEKNFLDEKVYITSGGSTGWVTNFLTYNREIDRPTSGLPMWGGQQRCDDFTYKRILSNISQIITESPSTEEDVLFIFDDAACNEEIVSHLESILNKKRSSFSIFSKSCRKNFLYSTIEIKKEELGSVEVHRLAPTYAGKRYEALRDVQIEKMVEGLAGKYYNDINLKQLKDMRVDKNVNFNWQGGSPFPSIEPDYFSVEWNGYIRADSSGVYWFYTKSDNGVRLWIEDDLIIDNWNPNLSYELCEPVFLEKGLHKIKLQYFESDGFAAVSLAWASEHFWKIIVTGNRLFCVSPEE